MGVAVARAESPPNRRVGDTQSKTPARLASCGRFFYSVGWLMGLEPTTTGITIRDSTN